MPGPAESPFLSAGYRLWYDLTELQLALATLADDVLVSSPNVLAVVEPEWLRAYA